MNEVKEPHVFVLLDRALRALREDMAGRFPQTPEPALRASQRRLLSLVPDDGIRVTELAQRAGMTAQSLGEFARVLAGMGLLTLEPDPSDRRARVVRLTGAGRDAEREGDAVIRVMEAEWRDRLGPRAWDTLRRTLERMGDQL